jgi:hypothetical protein
VQFIRHEQENYLVIPRSDLPAYVIALGDPSLHIEAGRVVGIRHHDRQLLWDSVQVGEVSDLAR